jgi:hypothetical protein
MQQGVQSHTTGKQCPKILALFKSTLHCQSGWLALPTFIFNKWKLGNSYLRVSLTSVEAAQGGPSTAELFASEAQTLDAWAGVSVGSCLY